MQVSMAGDKAIAEDLIDVARNWARCVKCPIGHAAHRHVLWELISGDGVNKPRPSQVSVMFIGEGPGQSEDDLGKPFIGPSGRILREAIQESNTGKLTYCLTNLVACRPRDVLGKNREPNSTEVVNCRARLVTLIYVLKPSVIVATGKLASGYMAATLADVHGYQDTYFPVTKDIKHPSYILRLGGREAKEYPKWRLTVEGVLRVAKLENAKRKVQSANQT